MTTFGIFVILLLACLLLFVTLHLRPLSGSEVAELATIRRAKQIDAYFTFHYFPYAANPEFKKAMNASGAFYKVNHLLGQFPSLAGKLLKYKKHEWVIVAFEKNREVMLMWLNKGPNRQCVGLTIPSRQLVELAQKEEAATVIWFHNHPNSNPSRYSCHRPSTQDLTSARSTACDLNAAGVTLLEFVCERGHSYEYFRSVADNFIPVESIRRDVEKANGIHWSTNLSMHLERVFASSRHAVGYSSAARPMTENATRPVAAAGVPVKRLPVRSRAFKTVGYDPERQILEVEFHSGGVYRHTNVPQQVFYEFVSSGSLRMFYYERIARHYEEQVS